jgi:hypothetical protein
MNRVIAHFQTSSDYYRLDDKPAQDENELARRVMRNMGSDPEGVDSYAMRGNEPTFYHAEYLEALTILYKRYPSVRESIIDALKYELHPLMRWSGTECDEYYAFFDEVAA